MSHTLEQLSAECRRVLTDDPGPTGRERVAGRFLDLDTDGALLMADADGRTRKLTFGDVTLTHAAAKDGR